jgi:predicted ATPase/DNA-binding winged helix-turn-helix (wHTH) protein
MQSATEQILSFGPFRLSLARRVLLRNDQPVRLSARALDILVALAEAGGHVLSNRELEAAAWPNARVDETNLRVQLSGLRKALGEQQGEVPYIINVPGRGYRLGVAVDRLATAAPLAAAPASASAAHGEVPSRPTSPVIGRDRELGTIVEALKPRRCLSIVGPGGIGKTTVAAAVARQLSPSLEVRFIDLGPVTNPLSVSSVISAALNVAVHPVDPLSNLVAALSHRAMLLVLDCCEHVIEATASLVEAVLTGAPEVRLLVTSREPLRVYGEQVYRLPPLGSPPSSATLTAIEAMAFPAIALFVERARETDVSFMLTNANAPLVSDICRRLDGIALAVELAAGRVDAFGVAGLHTMLDDRFRLLSGGRRNRVQRHRTVQALIDWSYGHLAPQERSILCRLAVLVGNFDLNAATAIAGDSGDSDEVIETIANLVEKSLIFADISGKLPVYRLLDMTRASVLLHLRDSGELDQTCRRHAEYHCNVLETIERNWSDEPRAARIESYRGRLDNIRAALTWSFAENGNRSLARRLTIASVQPFRHLALAGEGIGWVRAALAILADDASGEVEELQLQAALGWLLFDAFGPTAECGAALERSIALAERHGNVEIQLRAFAGLWGWYFNRGEMRQAAKLGERTRVVADTNADRAGQIRATVTVALTDHMLGRQASARRHIEDALASYDDECQRVDDLRMVHYQVSTLHSFHARILWMQGLPERAMAVVAADLEREETRAHSETFGIALLHGLPVVAGCGDMQKTIEMAATLARTAQRNGLGRYGVWASAYESIALLAGSEVDAGLTALRDVLTEVRRLPFEIYVTQLLLPYALGLLKAGRIAEARVAVGEAMAILAVVEEHWIRPEVLRVDGEVRRREASASSSEVAEQKFREAAQLARQQGALWWELRATTSLANLLDGEGRSAEAVDMLADVLAQFTEGFNTPDVIEASTLLNHLREATPR